MDKQGLTSLQAECFKSALITEQKQNGQDTTEGNTIASAFGAANDTASVHVKASEKTVRAWATEHVTARSARLESRVHTP